MRFLTLFFLLLVVVAGCKKAHEETWDNHRSPVADGAPITTIRIAKGYESNGMSRIDGVLRKFAGSQRLVERKLISKEIYSGPQFSLVMVFENERFAIWRRSQPVGEYKVAPKTTNYSMTEFTQLTNSMITALQAAFPGRVEVNPTKQSSALK